MPRQGHGFKIIVNGQVHGARTMGEAATVLLRARESGATSVRAKKCLSLTRDRDLTAREAQALVNAATNLLARAG